MKTAYISHSHCCLHDMGSYHPESPERLRAIEGYLENTGLIEDVLQVRAQPAPIAALERAHPAQHVAWVRSQLPTEGLASIDPDTALCPHSIEAADLAAGAMVQAVDGVIAGDYGQAFCAVRPPGHHAEYDMSMGFCLFNNVAVGVKQAQAIHGLARIAVLDFDVHHGNGTVDIFKDDPSVLVCSSFQHPFYPGRKIDIQRSNIVYTPLQAGTGGSLFRKAIERDWLPALERQRPEMIFVSAGFDAHRDDPLGGLELVEDDYLWITGLIVNAANDYAGGKVVSILEGGYDLDALAHSVHAHIGRLNGSL